MGSLEELIEKSEKAIHQIISLPREDTESVANMDEVVELIRSALISTKGKSDLRTLQRDFKMIVGEDIPYKRLGYNTLEQLLQNIPTLELTKQPNGQIFVDAVATANVKHIVDMVSRQKTSKKSKRVTGRSSGKPSFRHHQHLYQQNWKPAASGKRWGPALQGSPRPAAMSHRQTVIRAHPNNTQTHTHSQSNNSNRANTHVQNNASGSRTQPTTTTTSNTSTRMANTHTAPSTVTSSSSTSSTSKPSSVSSRPINSKITAKVQQPSTSRDPTLRKSGIGMVFIKNLEKRIDNKSLFDTFSAFGNILSCKVARDSNGDSKGFGFVHFETQEGVNKAISKVNGMLLNGKKVYVGQFVARVDREKQLGEKDKLVTNVFLKNFGDKLDDESILKMFELYGFIKSYKMVKNDDGSSKGFGFVAYKDPKSANLAVRNLNGKKIADGVTLYVGRAQKRSEREAELQKKYDQMRSERFMRYQGSTLFIKNLDHSIDDERLRREFETYGTITSVIVMRDNGRSKGFGFVCFSTPEAATKAVTEMNSRLVGSKPLYVAFAQRKEDRKAYLSSMHLNRPNFRGQPQQFANNVNGFYGPPQSRLYSQPSITPMRPAGPTPRWSIPAHIRACAPGGTTASLVTPVYNLRPYCTSSMPNNNVLRSILPRPITGGQDGQRKRSNNNNSSLLSSAPLPPPPPPPPSAAAANRTRIVQPRQVRFQVFYYNLKEPSPIAISPVKFPHYRFLCRNVWD